jgi:ABC-type glycerol-3-phosphate transport system substrate-binding protein
MPIRTRQTSVEWSAGIVPPVTASKAVAKLQEALDYADDAVNEVLSTLGGTIPPARSIMPELFTARDQVVNARSAIKSLADRTPDADVNPTHVATGQRLGANLIDAANEAMNKAHKSDSPAEVIDVAEKAVERVATKAAKGLFYLGSRAFTPLEVLIGVAVLDEMFNGGKIRRGILKGR